MRRAPSVQLLAVSCLFASVWIGPAHAARPIDRGAANPAHRAGTHALRGGTGAFPDASPRFHRGADLLCSDCHIQHASQTHAGEPGAPGVTSPPYLGTPNASLLKTADPLDLCLSCHDGRNFAPDVMGADANGLAQRSAGHFGMPEVRNFNGHDLGRGLPPTDSWDFCMRCHFSDGSQAKVTCIDCHNPHGNGIARNLQWASYPEGTPDLALFSNPAATGISRYESENVSYGTLDSPTLREASNMCLDCHHVFSGASYIDPNSNGIHDRHPTYDSERSSTNRINDGVPRGTTAPAHWSGGSGSGFGPVARVRPVVAGATGFTAARVIDPATNGVFCLSCHRAHGSDEPFGLVWPVPFGPEGPGCDQCHNVAGPQPEPQAKAATAVRSLEGGGR